MEKNSVVQDAKKLNFWQHLQQALRFYNFPETEDRTENPRTSSAVGETTLVVIGEPLKCLSLCIEGGRQCPGRMFLVPSDTWLQTQVINGTDGDEDVHALVVHQAVTFDSCGRTYLDVFSCPRPVTFLMNLQQDMSSNGFHYTVNSLNCLTGLSEKLERYLNDPLLTRILVADAGVLYPNTLAFPYRPRFSYSPGGHNIIICPIENNTEAVHETIRKQLDLFIGRLSKMDIEKVVMKAPGRVSYYGAKDSTMIYHDVIEYVRTLEEGESVMVSEYCETLQPFPDPAVKDEERRIGIKKEPLSCTIRAVVCSSPDGNPMVADIVCGVGHVDTPLHCDNTLSLSLETVLLQWGFQEKSDIDNVHSLITEKAKNIFKTWVEFEKNLSNDERGVSLARANVIGVNFILTQRKDGSLDAMAVSINDSRDTIAIAQNHEFQNPNKLGKGVRTLLTTIVNQSQRFLLREKRILIIGGGKSNMKKWVWEGAKEYGVKIILIDPDPNHCAATQVHTFIQCDIGVHTRDEDVVNAKKVVQILREREIKVDGCMVVEEACIPLVALVCHALRMIGSSPDAARKAKKKSLTQKALVKSSLNNESGILPKPSMYVIKTHEVVSLDDVTGSSKTIQYPAVLKLEHGCLSYGVFLVRNEAECRKYFIEIQGTLEGTTNRLYSVSHGMEMQLAEYAPGIKHGVEVVVSRGKILAAFISDCGPSLVPNFHGTTSCMPSCLSQERQEQLITATAQSVAVLGFDDGVFSVEFKMTPTGPKLIEVNGRITEAFFTNWIREVYETDILFLNFLISCGISPDVRPLDATCQLIGVECFGAIHREALASISTPEILAEAHSKEELIYFKQDTVEPDPDDHMSVCAIAVKGKSVNEAKGKLLAVCKKYGVDCAEYPVEQLLSVFH